MADSRGKGLCSGLCRPMTVTGFWPCVILWCRGVRLAPVPALLVLATLCQSKSDPGSEHACGPSVTGAMLGTLRGLPSTPIAGAWMRDSGMDSE